MAGADAVLFWHRVASHGTGMIGRQTIELRRKWDLEELRSYLEPRWDESIGPAPKRYEKMVIGDYLVLPATPRFVVLLYPNRKGVVLITYPGVEGWATQILSTIPARSIVSGYYKISAVLDKERERKGPAEEMLLKYAGIVGSILKEAERSQTNLISNTKLPAGDRSPNGLA